MELDEAQTLAWRLCRHSLVSPQESGVAEVIDRVVAMRAWPMHAAKNAIRIRRANSIRGPNSETRTLTSLRDTPTSPQETLTSPQETLAEAQKSGSVIRSYSLRGGSCFFTPKTGANLLSAHTATQSWRSSRFQRQGSFAIDDWEPLREAVHEACSLGPRTRKEISAEVQTIPSLRHLQKGLSGAGANSLYKPLRWWGDICFGPTRDGQSTFRWLRDDPAWPGLPPVDEAGMQAITDYAHSYGPVTWDNLRYWFVAGLGVRRATVDQWLTSMSDILVPVTVRGVDAFVLADDLDDIRSMPQSMPQSMSQQETLLFSLATIHG